MDFQLNETNKRVWPKYVSNAKRYKRSKKMDACMQAGMQGILITCNMNWWKCATEACSLLTEYGERLYSAEQLGEKEDKPSVSEEQDEDDNDEDGEVAQTAPEKKVDQSRALTEKNLPRFETIESGMANVLFMRSFNVEPEKLVHYILKDLYTTKQKKTQALIRMLPVCATCIATLEDFRKCSETFLQSWFKPPNEGTFQILYKARSTHNLSRDIVVDYLAAMLSSLSQKNRFDVKNPEYTIAVDVIRDICCLGVVKDYNLLKKYNLQEVIKSV